MTSIAIAKPLTPVSIQLKWKHQFQFAGYYAAQEMGYYKDEGLTVDIREWENNANVIEQVIQNKANFGVGDATILSEFVNGQPIVAIAAIFQEDPMVLFTKKSSGIVKPKDLIGKRVQFNADAVDGPSIRAMLLQQGVEESSYQYIKQDYNYQELIDGKIDAISGYLSTEAYWYKEQQLAVNIINPFQYGINFYNDILFSSQAYVKANPDTVEKFRRASLKGWLYAATHLDETIALIQNQYNPKLSYERLLFEAQSTVKLMDYPMIEIGDMHQQRWEYVAGILRQQKMLNKEVDFERFIYQPKQENFWIIIYALLSVIAVFLLVVIRQFFNRRKLMKSVNRLTSVYGATGRAWFDFDLQTGKIEASDEYGLMLGFSPGEFNSSFKEWQENIHPDDRAETLAKYSEYTKNGNVCEMEYRRKNKSGKWVWLHSVGQVIEWNNQGKPVRAVGIHSDISSRKQIEITLKESESRLRLSQIAGGIGTWEYDYLTNTSHCSSNVALQLKFPWASENSTWDDVFAAIYQEDHELVNKNIEQHITQGTKLDFEYRITDTEGEMRWMRSTGNAEFDESGNLLKLRGTVQDVTQKKELEEQLQLAAEVFKSTQEGVVITDKQCNIVDINPAFTEITGYSRSEVLGKNPKILNSGKQDAEFYEIMWSTLHKEGFWRGEIWNRHKDGSIYAELLTLSEIKNKQGKVVNYAGIFADITQNKKQQDKISQLAHYDLLTQLPNRVLFTDRFKGAMARSKRNKSLLAVCFLDLDGFKPVNDTFGHEMGDKVLIEVAKRIVGNVREIDTVSRQGGDEFVILLNDIDSTMQCEKTMQRIHQSLEKAFVIDGQTLNLSASSGVTLSPYDKGDSDTLLRHADDAMYQAKKAGKNQYRLFTE